MQLEEFLETHGNAAQRIAGTDDLLHECLVLPFEDYCEAYNGVWGTLSGYILMRLRFSVLKALARERKHFGRAVQLDVEVVQQGQGNLIDIVGFNDAYSRVDPDMQLVLEMWVHGYSQTAISDELRIGIRKVRARMSAGFARLKDELCALRID